MAKETNREAMIEIEALRTGRISPWLVGITPLILNSMSAKTLQTLLMPRKKTAADKAQNLKHEPLDEYRSAPYKRTGTGPTRIVFPAAAFKGACATRPWKSPVRRSPKSAGWCGSRATTWTCTAFPSC